MSNLSNEQVQAIQAQVLAGRKIEAIVLYRRATGCGLKEAKDFIEGLEARLRQESPELFTATPSAGCARAAALLIAISLAGLALLLLRLIG